MSAKDFIQIDLKPPLKFDDYTLSHLGKSTAHGEIYVPYHMHHNFYELTVITSGKGISYAENTGTPVKKGDIFVSFPFEHHRIDSHPVELLSYSFICFDVFDPRYSGKLRTLWFDHLPPENRIIHNDAVSHLIDCVITEIQSGKEKYFDNLIPAILEQITVYMLRGFADRIPYRLSNTPTDTELCKHISHYIDTHIFTMKQLSECARELSYNYSYLTTVFKKTTGITLSEYHRSKKLDMAKSLIAEKEHSLSDIAELLGYSGISAFSKAYSAKFGMSPREYARLTSQT